MIFVCHEPPKSVYRNVIPLSRTPEAIADVIEKMNTVPNFLTRENPEAVFHNQLNSFYLVDDVGLLAVIDSNGEEAHCHITFWDKRLKGREGLCRELACLHMEASGLTLLWTAIPDEFLKVIAFAKKVGFKIHERIKGVTVLTLERN